MKVDINDPKTEKLIENMTLYFSEIPTYLGLTKKLSGVNEELGKMRGVLVELNKNIKEANESSEKLTRALNKISKAGVLVGLLAVIVAALNLAFEIYKYCNR
ncbi:MAG TPA: hypothetical protein PKU78_04280 [Candidatus Dojkabacteria bacterium]|nr:hypothetical protein [Candidatus Dojkabacteria bacterium]HRO65411.1 hypothetical protein [Candidatus Dojkabacteria bacterium]HRP36749.1 hypothetical protein [Candidatus Dojkabacteria bacterium]HRP51312.1 hypothetical protein [Candidatus Dojkabacteria bacterium]